MEGRMSSDIKWVIGTGVVLAGLLGGLLSAQIQGLRTDLNTQVDNLGTSLNTRIDSLETSLNTRIDDLNTNLSGRMDRLESRLDGLNGQLRDVEIAVGKLDQRLLTIERVVLPANDQPAE